MGIKGFENFRRKIPRLSGKRIVLLPLYFILVMVLSIAIMICFDSIPGKVGAAGGNAYLLSLFPLIGALVMEIIGLILVYQMWFWRERLKTKYGPLSYQRIFLAGFGGVICLLSLSINLFIHYWSFSSLFWAASPLRFLTLPLESYALGSEQIIFIARICLAILFSLLGLTMMLRSLQTFGIDYMTVVYLYFPEESEMQNHAIYSVIRHPMYAGALILGLGGMFSTFTSYSIILFIFYLAGFYFHVRFVEEKELIRRFGETYVLYRKEVPAFFPSPEKIGLLFSFLLGKSSKGANTT